MLETLVGKTIKSQELWSDIDPDEDFNKHFFIETTDGMTFYQMFIEGLDQFIVFSPVTWDRKKRIVSDFTLKLQEKSIDTLENKTVKSLKAYGNTATVDLQKFYFLETTDLLLYELVFTENYATFNQFEPITKAQMDYVIMDHKLIELEATDYDDI